jgi:hypothetical protein
MALGLGFIPALPFFLILDLDQVLERDVAEVVLEELRRPFPDFEGCTGGAAAAIILVVDAFNQAAGASRMRTSLSLISSGGRERCSPAGRADAPDDLVEFLEGMMICSEVADGDFLLLEMLLRMTDRVPSPYLWARLSRSRVP